MVAVLAARQLRELVGLKFLLPAFEVAARTNLDHDGPIMRRASLVHAKAHLSELVDEAEHKKRPVIILRHGKPAAAIVPIEAVPALKHAATRAMTADEARALLDQLAASAPESTMSIEEALGRNRLDRS